MIFLLQEPFLYPDIGSVLSAKYCSTIPKVLQYFPDGIAAEFVYQYRLERIVLSGEHLLLHPDESSGIFHWGRVSEVGTILVFCAPLGVEQLQDMASLQQGLVG